MEKDIRILSEAAAHADILRLFLDYDGTLAEFAPTPDVVLPNPGVIALLRRLVSAPGILPVVISGRRLGHIQKLLPLSGLMMGGTYGIEVQMPDGSVSSGLPFDRVRPTLEELRPRWQALIEGREGFYLEDKGWTLALHGRFASPAEAEQVISAARAQIESLQLGTRFRILGGDRFLELAPQEASKTAAVQRVLHDMTPKGALSIYLGDDDKDEEAFETLLNAGGQAVRVSAQPTETRAQFRLAGPPEVRAWLAELLAVREAQH
jgi:trehalose 6-phosphate phosphatase